MSANEPEVGGPADRELARRREPHVEIILIRHGEPNWSPEGGASVPNPALTAYGHAQAEAVAQDVAQRNLDAIYVSPLARAQQTAEPLIRASGVAATTLDTLAEIDVGATGLSPEEVDRYFVEAMQRPLVDHWEGWPAGETFRNFHTRVVGGCRELLERHDITAEPLHDFTVWHLPPNRKITIVVVAHGGTNAVLLTHLLDVRPVPWEWLRFESELASFSVAQARPIGERGHVWSLQNFNEIDPLRAAGLR